MTLTTITFQWKFTPLHYGINELQVNHASELRIESFVINIKHTFYKEKWVIYTKLFLYQLHSRHIIAI